MPYVPGFSYDLFLSYASEDDADGWVEDFKNQLTSELRRIVGRPFSDKSVYFDSHRLEVGQHYPSELDRAARESAVLVALVSPSYVSSSWCSRERQVFQERIAPGAALAESLAVVRVRPPGPLPAQLEQAQHADFVIEGFEEPWPAGSGKCIEAIHKLARDIKSMLQRMRSRAGAVFVGAPLNDRIELREKLADYLAQRHLRAEPHPVALLDDRARSQRALAEAACAVHFVGGASVAALDCIEDSLALCPGPTVVFQPHNAPLSATEEVFLADLPPERYPHRLGPNEVELEHFLEDLLARRPASAATAASLGLVCDLPDLAWAGQFQADGLSVEYPRFLQEKLTTTDRVRRWRQFLRDSQGLLFYQGRSNETFLAMLERLAAEEKSAAIRRWYLDNPDLEAKRQRRPSDPIYPTGLEEFLDQVRAAARSARASASAAAAAPAAPVDPPEGAGR